MFALKYGDVMLHNEMILYDIKVAIILLNRVAATPWLKLPQTNFYLHEYSILVHDVSWIPEGKTKRSMDEVLVEQRDVLRVFGSSVDQSRSIW